MQKWELIKGIASSGELERLRKDILKKKVSFFKERGSLIFFFKRGSSNRELKKKDSWIRRENSFIEKLIFTNIY